MLIIGLKYKIIIIKVILQNKKLDNKMTEHYWQRYKDLVSMDPLNRDDPFWKGVKSDLDKRAEPKHHLELYSMCKS